MTKSNIVGKVVVVSMDFFISSLCQQYSVLTSNKHPASFTSKEKADILMGDACMFHKDPLFHILILLYSPGENQLYYFSHSLHSACTPILRF